MGDAAYASGHWWPSWYAASRRARPVPVRCPSGAVPMPAGPAALHGRGQRFGATAAEPPTGSAAGPARGIPSPDPMPAADADCSRRAMGACGRTTDAMRRVPASPCVRLVVVAVRSAAVAGRWCGRSPMRRRQTDMSDRLGTPGGPVWGMRRTHPVTGDRLGTPHRAEPVRGAARPVPVRGDCPSGVRSDRRMVGRGAGVGMAPIGYAEAPSMGSEAAAT